MPAAATFATALGIVDETPGMAPAPAMTKDSGHRIIPQETPSFRAGRNAGSRVPCIVAVSFIRDVST